MRRLFAACTGLAVLACWPSTAAFADTGLAVFVTPAKPAAADDARLLQTLFRKQIPTLEGLSVVTASGAPRTLPDGVLEDIEAGYRALADKKPDEALPAFTRARDALLGYSGPMDVRALARATKGIAVAHALADRKKEAEPFIRDTLILWPQQKPEDWAWTVDVLTQFAEVSKAMETAAAGKLEITTEPAGAVVRVDGEARGRTPLTLDSVAPGTHWLELELDGFRRLAEPVAMAPEGAVQVTKSLTPIPDKETFDELTAKLPNQRSSKRAEPQAQALRKLVGADAVLIVDAELRRDSSYTIAGYFVAEGKLVKVKETMKRDAALLTGVQQLLATLTGAQVATAKAVPEALDGPPAGSLMEDKKKLEAEKQKKIAAAAAADEVEFYETWWFWTAIGGAVVIGVTAAVLVVVLDEDEGPGYGALDIHLNDL